MSKYTLELPKQEFTSVKTSINFKKIPIIYDMIDLQPNMVIVDFGGGKFDNVVEYYRNKGIDILVYDPYDRTEKHNEKVLDIVKSQGGADIVVCSNVLNVIKEDYVRKTVLTNIKKIAKKGAKIYFTMWEGSRTGIPTSSIYGYQSNKKTKYYLTEIQEVFPNAIRKSRLIMAENIWKESEYDSKRIVWLDNKNNAENLNIVIYDRINGDIIGNTTEIDESDLSIENSADSKVVAI